MVSGSFFSPDINLCHEDFTVVGDSIYYGLAVLKNVGKEAIRKKS